jgi:hypothetical protein
MTIQYTRLLYNKPIGRKIYQVPLQDPDWDFWFENISSGNPVRNAV